VYEEAIEAAGLPDYSLPPADVPCPYKGLLPFEPEDSELFFGREQLVEDVADAWQPRASSPSSDRQGAANRRSYAPASCPRFSAPRKVSSARRSSLQALIRSLLGTGLLALAWAGSGLRSRGRAWSRCTLAVGLMLLATAGAYAAQSFDLVDVLLIASGAVLLPLWFAWTGLLLRGGEETAFSD
jgi:hypothetical protein